MSIPIYEAEKADNLAEQIKANASVAYIAQVDSHVPTKSEMDLAKSLAFETLATNKDQFDLYYINSVLVSTGWNKNDDVFDREETWAARNTPQDKQFNFGHDEKDIIGHITDNMVIARDGNVVSEESQLPNQFDIITSAVLYNSWTDPELKERMARIIAEIEEGKWFVSMEALFSNFDYAVVTPDGSSKTIARNEESAFLTKHLRAYGGTGKYEGYEIGRLLRNITFSGKGLVSNPANPRSVIIRDADPFQSEASEAASEAFLTQPKLRENEMSDILEKQVEELKAELAETKAHSEALETAISKQKDEEFNTTIEAFEATIAEKEAKVEELKSELEQSQAKISEVEESLEAVQAKLDEAEAKIEAQEAEAKLTARKTALMEAGASEEEAEETLATFADATDEMFEQVVALMKKRGNFPPKKKDNEEEEDSEKPKASEEDPEEEEDATDEAEAEAEPEVLEEVEEEAEAALTDAGDDELEDLRVSASSWLETNVLRTTANIKE
tara:strand:- start:65 stop:1570 length:1506 start_codon:yes stop_codon:yes gene_type:complete